MYYLHNVHNFNGINAALLKRIFECNNSCIVTMLGSPILSISRSHMPSH